MIGFFKDTESAEAKEYLSAASSLEEQVQGRTQKSGGGGECRGVPGRGYA